MQLINLSAEPSQQFTVGLNEHNFDITLRDVGGMCIMDITVDGDVLARALPVFPNQPVIPYPYLARFGNFVFFSATDDYPTWEMLGKSVNLYFLTPEEIAEVANA